MPDIEWVIGPISAFSDALYALLPGVDRDQGTEHEAWCDFKTQSIP